MSEPIPESIPTSADPRSKRPLKKSRGPDTAASAQAASLTALFSKPDQEIRFPPSLGALTKTNPGSGPPEIVANVQGSSAGAGSGEFHVYKASRRREYERLRAMDEEVKGEQEAEEFEKLKKEREEKDAEKTRKNREKRERMKNRRGKGKGFAEGRAVKEPAEKMGGMKARVTLPAKEAKEDELENEQEAEAVQEQGLVIHDDD